MTGKKSKPPQGTSIKIDGNVSGQIAVGNNISQSQVESHYTVTEVELGELRALINELRGRVEAEATPDVKGAALERVGELEQAITEEEKPDLSTMEYVKKWFGKHVPALAGMVASVVIHPIVGKLVEAGGDLLVEEFRRRFGEGS